MKIKIKKKIDKKDIANAKIIFFKDKITKNQKKVLWSYSKNKQFLIYLKNQKDNLGMIRVIIKKFYLHKKVYLASCLSTIGIFPKYQKKGYSKILLNKTNDYLKTKFDISLLIARKKLDRFYTKFNFLGNTEFCNAKFRNINYLETSNKFTSSKVNSNVKKIYTRNFINYNGTFNRDSMDWSIIKNKIKREQLIVKVLRIKKNYIGYIILKDNTIYEHYYDDFYLKEFYMALKALFKKNIIIKILNPCQNLLHFIRNETEVKVSKRLVGYGGHMINFYNHKKLKKIYFNINYLDEF